MIYIKIGKGKTRPLREQPGQITDGDRLLTGVCHVPQRCHARFHFFITDDDHVTDIQRVGLSHLRFQASISRGRRSADACLPETGS